MSKEIWKPIKGYEGLYEVSSFGRVKSHRQKKGDAIRKCAVNSKGYYQLILMCKTHMEKTITVHRLVAQAFIPNPDNKPYVNHKDGNKLNNAVSNLEWCTARENSVHAIQTGLANSNRGVCAYNAEGELVAEFDSIAGAALLLQKGHATAISHCLSGKSKTAFGYKWAYAQERSGTP